MTQTTILFLPEFKKQDGVLKMDIYMTGVYIWYYNICKRQVWLMAHSILPDENDDNIVLGRFLHEYYYRKDQKEIKFGNALFDILYQDKDEIVIGETKKSSRFKEASRYQVLFYIKLLKEAGISAKGVLFYPEERKKEEVVLTAEEEEKLEKMIADIETIIEKESPPPAATCRYCPKCAYREYCFA